MNIEWTPTSKALPSPDIECLITCQSKRRDHNHRWVSAGSFLSEEHTQWRDDLSNDVIPSLESYDHTQHSYCVVAWAPFPAPYESTEE